MLIGVYETVSLLGRGATGTVYACRHATLGRRAAVKLLHPDLVHNPLALARFRREGRALARIHHPNVIEVLDFGEHEHIPYLVMELADGDDFRTFARQKRPLPIETAVDCVIAVAAGVAAAHRAGIVHRDLKPSNIRFSRDHLGRWNPKVLDFGVSKFEDLGADIALTDSTGALGTAIYMAPEQIASAKDADARSDVYALGVILYELLTGQSPFAGSTVRERMHSAAVCPIVPPIRLRADMPAALDEIVLKATERSPDQRFDSARGMGAALVPFATDPRIWLLEFGASCASKPPSGEMGRTDGGGTPVTLSVSASPKHRSIDFTRQRAVGRVFMLAGVLSLVIASIAAARLQRPVSTHGPSGSVADVANRSDVGDREAAHAVMAYPPEETMGSRQSGATLGPPPLAAPLFAPVSARGEPSENWATGSKLPPTAPSSRPTETLSAVTPRTSAGAGAVASTTGRGSAAAASTGSVITAAVASEKAATPPKSMPTLYDQM